MRIALRLTNELMKKTEIFTIEAYVIPIRHDIVIGRRTLSQRTMVKTLLFSEFIETDEDLEAMCELIQKKLQDRREVMGCTPTETPRAAGGAKSPAHKKQKIMMTPGKSGETPRATTPGAA